MKILFVSQFIYKPDQAGANRIYDFLQLLAKRGHEVEVVAGGVHYINDVIDPELERNKRMRTRWEDVNVTLTYASPDFRKSIVARLRSYLSFTWYAFWACLQVGRVDVILVSIQPLFIAPLAWLIAKFRRADFILEVRDLWPDTAIHLGALRNRPAIWLGRMLEATVYRMAKHIIVIGYEMKRVLVRKGVPEGRIDVLPQGYQPAPGPVRTRDETRAELGLGDDFVVMFTGSYGQANIDLPTLIEAASRLKDEGVRFELFGQGNQQAGCEARCKRDGLDHVRFHPMRPKSEVPGLLAGADACIMTLPPGEFWKIFLQNKIFDYLGAGLPVVAAVAGDQKDLLEDAEAGIVVEPGDAAGLADAIRRVKSDPELRSRLSENGKRYVRRHLLRDDIIARYAELLERVTARADRPPRDALETKPTGRAAGARGAE